MARKITTMKDICRMCTEYDEQRECEAKANCPLMEIYLENGALRRWLATTRKELEDTKLKMSYMINPNAIGERNDMGW